MIKVTQRHSHKDARWKRKACEDAPIHLFVKPVVDVGKIFRDCFVILEIVLQDSCILKNTLIFSVALENGIKRTQYIK